MKKLLVFSALSSFSFIIISFIYVFSGLSFIIGEYKVLRNLDTLLSYPAVMIWGAGYGGGFGAALLVMLPIFLVIGITIFGILYLLKECFLAKKSS